MPFLIIALAIGAFYFMSEKRADATSTPEWAPQNKMGLEDIPPPDQGGGYDQSNDYSFIQARDKWGVPFALLKATAIKESSLNPSAFRQEPNGRASYGLMQLLWWEGSNRFKQFGLSADEISRDMSVLYDPDRNVDVAAQLIMANWKACNGNLRDTINMYNTGVKESEREAPGGYVNKVLKYYGNIIGREVSNA